MKLPFVFSFFSLFSPRLFHCSFCCRMKPDGRRCPVDIGARYCGQTIYCDLILDDGKPPTSQLQAITSSCFLCFTVGKLPTLPPPPLPPPHPLAARSPKQPRQARLPPVAAAPCPQNCTMKNATSVLLSTPGHGAVDTTTMRPYDPYVDFPHRISDLGYTVIASLLTFVWVFGTIFSTLSLVVFATNKTLRSPTNMFVMSLNVCDLCMSCFGTFLQMTSSWNGKWLYGRIGCINAGESE